MLESEEKNDVVSISQVANRHAAIGMSGFVFSVKGHRQLLDLGDYWAIQSE